jgi:microcystin synthetase protein McyB
VRNIHFNHSHRLFYNFLTGSTLFNCYLNDLERTTNTFVTIHGRVYIKTGDLARYNSQCELVHVERVDFQIKVRGQRVETAEIENTIINWSPSKISNCLVTKLPLNDDLLVAYIISNDLELDIEKIRDYCCRQLCQYMVPSYFVVLDRLPINANGKIDRKRLPLPNLSSSTLSSQSESNAPHNQLEDRVHDIWCQVLRCDEQLISTTKSFFSIGGHSLLFIELYHRYQILFDFDTQTLSVASFLQEPTIVQHAKLLEKITTNDMKLTQWHTLHLIQGNITFCPLLNQDKIFYCQTFRCCIVLSRAYLS